MRRAITVLVAAGLAAAGGSSTPAMRSTTSPRLLGLVDRAGGTVLARLDPTTLAPVGAALALGRGPGPAWARSPDGARLAVGRAQGGIRIVDARRLRILRAIPSFGLPETLAWLSPRRVVSVEPFYVVLYDAVAGRIVKRIPLEGELQGVGLTPVGLVLLVAPDDRIGAARLVVVAASGRLRETSLTRVSAGLQLASGGTAVAQRRPGLAVDPTLARAFVVDPGGLVAEVDLARLSVAYHELVAERRPAAAAKGALPGAVLRAVWLGGDRLAVAGEVSSYAGSESRTDPTGLRVIDTRTWTSAVVAPDANHVVPASAGRLLAYGAVFDWATGRLSGSGIGVYRPDGSLAARLLVSAPVAWAQAYGARAAVALEGAFAVIDLDTGAVLRERAGPAPELIVGSAALWGT